MFFTVLPKNVVQVMRGIAICTNFFDKYELFIDQTEIFYNSGYIFLKIKMILSTINIKYYFLYIWFLTFYFYALFLTKQSLRSMV